jgi:hypothetical protein
MEKRQMLLRRREGMSGADTVAYLLVSVFIAASTYISSTV